MKCIGKVFSEGYESRRRGPIRRVRYESCSWFHRKHMSRVLYGDYCIECVIHTVILAASHVFVLDSRIWFMLLFPVTNFFKLLLM